MLLQDLLDRVRRDDVAEALECALHPVVAPGWVLARHADDELGDALHYEPSVGLPGRERPLLRDQSSVPPEDRLRRDDGCELVEQLPAESDAANGESDAVVIVESELPFAQLGSEDAVLLAEVVEDALLVAVQPAREEDGKDVNELRHRAGERSEGTNRGV